ncbi:uncharacterized protein LOC121368779 [Gigantopelta aegis]|uniref:uncharacterized protein LOC121368779 n=1 Tax=Gigantopelta aegis TaxID=1735272 RepID=UPI001B8888D8|nr:uncharacterized protein LOC121368779 [Gigantopelta aegis]
MSSNKEDRLNALIKLGIFEHQKDEKALTALRRRSLYIHRSRLPVHESYSREHDRRFRIVVFVVRFCIRQVKRHSLRIPRDELTPFIKQVHFHEDESAENDDLLFDASRFKVKRQNRMSEEMIRIWSKLPDSRTEQELYTVEIGVRSMPSFKEFPARMQRLIAEVGIYCKYEAKRVLVRQGNRAEYFYFILSGSVVVLVMDDEWKYARPVAYLYKGQSFGELAIINRTSRQSTVMAKETCELLKISVSDYHKIFMAGGVRNINDPDYDDFVGHLSFLQGWPVEKLQKQPSKCLFLYFKRGDVMVKDSHYSDWIIVVKSGSVSVLKKLKKVNAYKLKTARDLQFVCEKERVKRREDYSKWRQMLSGCDINLRSETGDLDRADAANRKPFQHPGIYPTTDLKESMPKQDNVRTQNCVQQMAHSQKSLSKTLPHSGICSSKKFLRVQTFGKPLEHKQGSLTYSYVPPVIVNDPESPKPPNRFPLLVSLRNTRARRRLGGKPFNKMTWNRYEVIDESTETDDSVFELVNTSARHSKRRQSELEREKEMMGFKQHVRTISEDLDSGIKRKDIDDVTAADLDPEFVMVQTLTKGQTFGLVDVILGKQTSFCVISNGADCLLINKQFYLDHVSEPLFRKIRHELCPYPTEEELQNELQISTNWEFFKKNVLHSALNHVKIHRPVRLPT